MRIKLIVISLIVLPFSKLSSQTDSLFYFDFADSIPTGWISTDLNGNNFNWMHTFEGIEAIYNPAFASELNSESSENGWMTFHAAFFNTDSDDVTSQVDSLVYMNSVFTSPAFNFSGESNVFISLSHYFQTLSSPQNGSLELGISSDSINWNVYDLHTGSDSPMNIVNGIEQISIDISQDAAFQENLWVRFHFRNLAWHFWNIDDVLISKNDLLNSNHSPSMIDNKSILYPNPIIDFAQIELSCHHTNFKVYSMHGLLLKEGYAEQQIDFSDLNPGSFIIELESCKRMFFISKQ